MGFEIERKFLVTGDGWKALVARRLLIRQAYLTLEGKLSIRVRIKDEHDATLTIKTRGAELRRLELEYPIPTLDAESLISLRSGSVIEKERYTVPLKGLTWEIDVFAGDNSGLVIAEIELPDELQQIELPPWVGAEITSKPEYYNASLVSRPFKFWHSHSATQAM